MKTFIFSALALGMMASCSNTEVEGIDKVDNGEPVAVNLIAGVQVSASSRAAIDEGGIFTASVFGWNATGETAPDYATATPWTSLTGNITAAANGGATVSLTTAQYYQTNGNKTYIKAISPAGGAITGGVYTFNTPLTGQEDVLLTKGILAGDRKNATVALAFSHVLTRLNFKVAKGDNFDAGVKVSKIVIVGGTFAKTINLIDGTITAEATAAIDITVADVEIVTAAANAGDPVMIVPCAASSLTLAITTTAGEYEKITISPTSGSNFTEGTSYDITLTFTGKSVGATASVGEWTAGTGTGTVE